MNKNKSYIFATRKDWSPCDQASQSVTILHAFLQATLSSTIQMLLRCCLIHTTIIMLSHILYLVYLYLCIDLGLFMSYLCDLFYIFSLVFIVINHVTSFKQTYLFFVHFLEYLLLLLDDIVDEESKKFSNSKSSVSGCYLAFS